MSANIYSLNVLFLLITLSGYKGLAFQEILSNTETEFELVEAESFHKQSNSEVRKWYVVSSESVRDASLTDADSSHASSASQEAYIEILPDTRRNHDEKLIAGENYSNEPGKMAVVHYTVDFKEAGRYYVWVKAFSTGSEDNGVHVGLDGEWPLSGQRMQWCKGKNNWTWASAQRTQAVHCGEPGKIFLEVPTPGKHEVLFSMREDGFEMDQFLLTKNPDFQPEVHLNKSLSTVNPSYGLKQLVKQNKKATIILAPDFETKTHLYVNNDWLAVNPKEYNQGFATTPFNGETGTYDIILFAVGENDGQSTYNLEVGDKKFPLYTVAKSNKTFEEGIPFTNVYPAINLERGIPLKVTANIASADGKEFSRARWAGLAIVPEGSAQNFLTGSQNPVVPAAIKIDGELKKWHKVTLTFDGPETSETAKDNPFMNYRLDVTFTHKSSGKSYLVPGYFAADGNAGETSAEAGNKWKVHFAPDETGSWEYTVDFRKGKWVAVSDRKNPGDTAGFMDGASGTFEIASSDKTGRDLRSRGRLDYVGERYNQFADSKEYFLKVGPDAPENFLAYADFDGTFHNDGHKDELVKTWEPHLKDWKPGDPTWKNGKGKAIIGVVNYLADKGLNVFSFLTNNIMGDDQNVFPYIDYDTYDRMDISKLDQWEILFEHADKLGMFLHFKTLEMENQGLLDNGGVGAYSKLYYRELIARFGHHLALNWNLGEENGDWVKNHKTPPQFTMQRKSMAQYFYDHDPYHHPVVIHNGNSFEDLLGPDCQLTGPSIQTHKADFSMVHGEVLHWLKASAEAGKPWAVAVDEPGDAQHSLLPDEEDKDHYDARRNALWGTFMAGGWGTEWYYGYKHPNSDLTAQDHRSRDLFWDQAVIAMNFFKNNVPYWEMENHNALVNNPNNENTVYCFAKPGEIYIIYLNSLETASLDLNGIEGDFDVKWFNPKTGGKFLETKVAELSGGSLRDLGNSPDKRQRDWAILITKKP